MVEDREEREQPFLDRMAQELSGEDHFAAADVARLLEIAKRYRRMDREAANYVESVICMRTRFTGEAPYVGWKGLGLALNEELDEQERLRVENRYLLAQAQISERIISRLRALAYPERHEPSLWDPEAEKAASERQGGPHAGEEASEATAEPQTVKGLPDAS